MKLLIISFFIFFQMNCSKSFSNPNDPGNSDYWTTQYLYTNQLARIINPPPSEIYFSTSSKAFYVGYKLDISYQASYKGGKPASYSNSPTLPSGISMNSSGLFSGTPTTVTSPSDYTITGCHKYGCASTTVNLRVVNATANTVYGQNGSFTSISTQTTSATSLNSPNWVIGDSSGGIYISDTFSHRVLYYPQNSTTATVVYGQSNFTSSGSSTSQTGLRYPTGLALTSAGDLYVTDGGNHRVLFYPKNSTTPTRVLGQADYTSSSTGTTSSKFNIPIGLAIDNSDGLYVVDAGNNRVLYFPSGATTATKVYGQSDFTSSTSGTSTTKFVGPTGVALDTSGGLYVSDYSNNRVLYFQAGSTIASKVLGQTDFTSNSINGLGYPYSIYVDSSGGIYVSEQNYNRVTYYLSMDSINSLIVYGQKGVTNDSSKYVDADGLQFPMGVFVNSSGKLYIADRANNRVLGY
ncbi:MAG: NHL repeat-containing protein [Leptospiraceae bacterium]|nr:NHL repeat-containing protein [Leptospiraceae bacterium]